MAEAQGSTQSFYFKKEATTNTEESGAGATTLRRVTGQLDLVKPEVLSQEKRDDFQELEQVHGTRSVNWAINSELFGGDYEEFMAAAVRRDFDAVADITGSQYAISSGSLTSDGNDLLTGGLRKGMVIRLSGMTESAVNARNIRLTGEVTAGSVPVEAVDGGAALVDSAAAGATISVPGKHSYIPLTGHTADTFTIERYDSETDTSHVARGCKVGVMDLNFQPDQPSGLSFSGLGVNRRNVASASAPSFSSPSSAGTGALMSVGLGVARINDAVQAVMTGVTCQINSSLQIRPVAYSNVTPNVYYGRAAQVTGSFNSLKSSLDLSDLFDGETEFAFEVFMEAPGSSPRAFVSAHMERVKANSADEDDPDGPTVQTFNYRALRPRSGTGVYLTTIMLQDSSLS